MAAVKFKGGTLISETYESKDTDEIGRLYTPLLGTDKKCILRSLTWKLKVVGVPDFVPLDDKYLKCDQNLEECPL